MQTLGLMHLRLDHCPEPVVDERAKKSATIPQDLEHRTGFGTNYFTSMDTNTNCSSALS
jgi:hypothetical protein